MISLSTHKIRRLHGKTLAIQQLGYAVHRLIAFRLAECAVAGAFMLIFQRLRIRGYNTFIIAQYHTVLIL